MMTFDKIADALLQEYGYRVLKCESDGEALDKAGALKAGSKDYPVHYSASDTSGEKAYEEFYTEGETADLKRFEALGVVTDKGIPDKGRIQGLFEELNRVFGGEQAAKEGVVSAIKAYLPNFEHIETGKSLDGKM